MGMAASQARFLSLTARKTNTEYEGQQINQQRTTLANQSANYYNQLMGMNVPTPPSSADFTKTTYTFTDGALTNTITSMIAQANGTYRINYTASYVNEHAFVSAVSPVVTRVTSGNNTQYRVGVTTLRPLGESHSDLDSYFDNLSTEERTALLEQENEYVRLLNSKYGIDENDPNYENIWLVRYTYNSTENAYHPVFYNKNTLNSSNTHYDVNGNSESFIPAITIGSAKETQEIKNVEAMFEKDSSGRLINLTLHPGGSEEISFALTTNTSTDQRKYDDAMNQYEFDKAKYDQQIQNINARIETIQAEDRTLELRLKQLDTEQNAIQTEMDAVKKVIQGNVSSTFKTFNG
jgi:hypothetical protein